MASSRHFALVSDVRNHNLADLLAVAAAVERQLTDDVPRFWGVSGTVSVFTKLELVPADYWPVIVSDKFTFPSLGFHQELNGTPYALVKYTRSYSQAVSHEMIEMLTDPHGERLVAGASVKRGQGRVNFLVEVCDPSEGSDFGYEVDGILVSDFYTQRYFDDEYQPGVRYSFTGAIKQPRQVLKEGYLTWEDPDDKSRWQEVRFGENQGILELPSLPDGDDGLRVKVDRVTPHVELERGLDCDNPKLLEAIGTATTRRAQSEKRAVALRKLIAELQQREDPSAA
jgi:hypothetical protein